MWDNGGMIAHISGVVVNKNGSSVVVDVNGVGYEIQISRRDYESTKLGEKVAFQTHHHIREQSQELFGFIDPRAKSLFEQLLGVKNVGPKVALAVLDIGTSRIIRTAIAGGDVWESVRQNKW